MIIVGFPINTLQEVNSVDEPVSSFVPFSKDITLTSVVEKLELISSKYILHRKLYIGVNF
jgi:hypothetical protein